MRVFISHAAADHHIARAVADEVSASAPALPVFLSSRPGDIRADAEWLPAIQAALLSSDSFLILLTANSVNRPWVAFETGVAWFSQRRLVLARLSELDVEEIPLPLNARQVYRIDQEDEAAVIFHDLGTTLSDPPRFVNIIRQALKTPGPTGLGELVWEGVVYGGNYFAWSGPLVQLDDRSAMDMPSGLDEELRARGWKTRLGSRDKLQKHQARGLARVYATDRRSWKREVMSEGLFLLVGGPSADPP